MSEKKKRITNNDDALLEGEILDGKSPAEILAQQVARQKDLEKRIKELEKIYLSQKEIFNFEEAAIYLNMSKSTLYKLTSKHEIPHYKPNRFVFFERSELDNWIRSAVVPTKQQLSDQATAYTLANPLHF